VSSRIDSETRLIKALAMDDQLKQLMDYTKFHIGMYTSLATLLIGVLTLEKAKLDVATFSPWLLVTLVFLVLAGMAGGMVGSSIPSFSAYSSFLESRLGPWRSEWFTGAVWIHLEHTFFWISIVTAVAGVFFTRI
jgi:amino acid transporter